MVGVGDAGCIDGGVGAQRGGTVSAAASVDDGLAASVVEG